MATYQGIKGLKVKYLSADPSNLAQGDVWYNSTSNTFKSLVSSEAWSSCSPMIADTRQVGCFGIQTSAVSAG